MLTTLRRLSPEARATYAQRQAGAKPTYGELGADRTRELVQRVPYEDYAENLRTLQQMGEDEGYAWSG